MSMPMWSRTSTLRTERGAATARRQPISVIAREHAERRDERDRAAVRNPRPRDEADREQRGGEQRHAHRQQSQQIRGCRVFGAVDLDHLVWTRRWDGDANPSPAGSKQIRDAAEQTVVLAELRLVQIVINGVLIRRLDDPAALNHPLQTRRHVNRVSAGIADAIAVEVLVFARFAVDAERDEPRTRLLRCRPERSGISR